ncbi:ABC transporter ATP-binding protein [Delftia lacustris]|uniref:ABC transporter ATP-binding protein n=1 Tax=Delftia TaxID=80865 RepID=UPI0003548CE5|nr:MULTISPECIES: ABC transporter ATP-binding protein [Delftia]PZP72328.1 MAG: ABC transporter ATP-binding protein [Delftia acidovorans]EPD41880.1 peptide/nickel transport system ATP-binding protein [Delftia acidovorans CCUG 274B]MDH0772128.1 ABC transporter ATP-binding protein [Delftia tsuruhatensis]MDH1456352.1 ABC transporter ATP-binding protein [Delftia tsuruhatensis]MDH1822371.1 ABC transporter ATP-binding protein [Delftia tsuruhatensis]
MSTTQESGQPPAQPAVLSVRGLSVTFDTYKGPVQVLDDVSFDIAPGEILGVVGESGAGKSMTGAAVIGLIEPPGRISAGTVQLRGERIDTLRGEDLRRMRGRRIGSIFQDPLTSLNPVYTVGRHLVETIRTHLPVSEKEAEARALALLEEVEIPQARERMAQYPHQFSGGMRQRVAIALALCAEPELIIADEPTTALDVSVQAQIIALLRRVCKERGAAAMLITHDMGVIAETADRVMVMYQGRVLETGPVRQVLDAPQQPYTQVLMGAIPSVHHRVQRLPVPEVGGGPAAPAVPWQPGAGAQEPAAALLEVRDLCKEFDLSSGWLARLLAREDKKILKAVDGVGFSIRRGSTFGLVGESGSGKSTVARMVAGLTPPTSGTVLFDGVDKWSPAAQTVAMRRRFQMIFQDPYASLNPRWTVQELIAEPLQVLALTAGKDETAERVQEALRRVRMKPDDARKYPHQFSGGQRQRIAIARALASRPEFIICDEPTSALDVSVQAQVLNLMRDLQEEFGLTYLLISHNLAVIRHMCDDIGVMQRGRLVETGEAGAVLDAPQHAYTRALMAAVPDMEHVH